MVPLPIGAFFVLLVADVTHARMPFVRAKS
jgi:hypothetical protein